MRSKATGRNGTTDAGSVRQVAEVASMGGKFSTADNLKT